MDNITTEYKSIFEDDEYGNKILEIIDKINEIIDWIDSQ